MADKRMFSKAIIDSDAFIDMPATARLLYYDLGMRADDDGFVNSPKKITRMIGASQDDLNVLIMRKFIIPFESGVIVIKHWNINNRIRKDTYKETTYTDEKSLLGIDTNNAYFLLENRSVTNPLRDRDESVTNPSLRLDKNRLDKYRLVEEEGEAPSAPSSASASAQSILPEPPVDQIIEAWNAKKCVKRITGIHAMTKRYDNTKLCFRIASPREFIRTIETIDEQAFFKKRMERNDPLKYDWFCQPDNFQKVFEGNYLEDYEDGDKVPEGWEVIK